MTNKFPHIELRGSIQKPDQFTLFSANGLILDAKNFEFVFLENYNANRSANEQLTGPNKVHLVGENGVYTADWDDETNTCELSQKTLEPLSMTTKTPFTKLPASFRVIVGYDDGVIPETKQLQFYSLWAGDFKVHGVPDRN